MSNENRGLQKFDPQKIALADIQKSIRQVYARNATDAEFTVFYRFCVSYNLSPVRGEVYFSKIGDVPCIMLGVEAFKAKAKQDPRYLRIISACVYEAELDEDRLEINYQEGQIIHRPILNRKKRGELMGAYAILELNDRKPIIAYADFAEFNSPDKYGKNGWSRFPETMIKLKAEKLACRQVFTFREPAGFKIKEREPEAHEISGDENDGSKQIEGYENEPQQSEYVDAEYTPCPPDPQKEEVKSAPKPQTQPDQKPVNTEDIEKRKHLLFDITTIARDLGYIEKKDGKDNFDNLVLFFESNYGKTSRDCTISELEDARVKLLQSLDNLHEMQKELQSDNPAPASKCAICQQPATQEYEGKNYCDRCIEVAKEEMPF